MSTGAVSCRRSTRGTRVHDLETEPATKYLVVLSLLACAAPRATPVLPDLADFEPAAPTAEHAWLMQGVGEWESVGFMESGGDAPMEMRSTESVRAIGEYWTVHESTADAFGTPFTAILTIGYDPEAKHFVGTWIDSSSSML